MREKSVFWKQTVMQTLDFVSGLHNYNCFEFSQPLSCFLLLK